MRGVARVLIGVVSLCLFAIVEPVAAQDFEPIEIALWSGVQIQARETNVSGLRLSLYGVNRSMSGLDVGVVARTTEDQQGVFYGFVGITEGDFSGWQAGQFANITKGRVSGIQTGFYNQAGGGTVGQVAFVNRVMEDAVGVQVGLVNTARSFGGARFALANVSSDEGRGFQLGLVNSVANGSGFMLGLVNVANDFDGLQIGLLNIINSKGRWPVIPLVNWSF